MLVLQQKVGEKSVVLRSPLLLSAEKANAPRTNALLSTGWIRGQWTNAYYNCIIDISLNYKYYKPSMISRFSSTISSVMHCRPSKGLGRVFALFAFEGMYLFDDDKSASVGILGVIKDFQEIKYTVYKNDNHYRGRG